MFEHIKTITLWFLILLSIFLTFQIWTFQPNYAILKSTEYIDNTQIGEEQKLQQIIKPKQVVLHQEDNFYVPMDNQAFMEEFYEKYLGVSLDRFTLTPTISTYNHFDSDNKLEFIFPTSIPVEALKEIYHITNDQFFISSVDRIILFLTIGQEKEQVNVKFISNEDRMVVEAQTNISVSQFKEDVFIDNTDAYYQVFPYDIIDYANGFKKTVFLPLESHYLNSVTYLAKPIPTEHFKQVLFSDPNFVKQYIQSNGEESFTDGNRMVNILQGGNILRYINPTFGDLIERSSKPAMFSAFDFLNGHGGFTNSFSYDSIKSYGSTEEITFRLIIDGLPVYGSNLFEVNNNLYEMTLHRGNGNQIEQYIRPLFFIENEPINITKSTKLPSGATLLEALEMIDGFKPYLLTDINYGFMMSKRQSFVIFEPKWFIHYNGQWEVVNIVDDSEGIPNGLE
jgi:regulatory protein YycH of two-component signal transduction system YycFG